MLAARTRISIATFSLTAAFLVGADAVADSLITTDGSKLVGKIEQWSSGKVIILTDIAGKLEIDAAKVASLSVDEPITIELASGDRLVGTVVQTPTGPAVRSAVGEVPLTTPEVKTAWRPDQESPDVAAVRAELEKTRLAYIPKWTMTAEAGLLGKEGNTDSLDANGRVDLLRKTPDDSLNFYLAARYSERDDERTTNEYLAGSRYEHNLSERWFWYLRSELEYDEFENLDLRATAAGGIGYYWIRKPNHELKTSVGAGYRHESYEDDTTRDDAVADLGLGYRVDLAPWAQFIHSTVYSPSLEEFNDYRLVVDTAMLFPLKQDEWKLKLGVKKEYNSQPIAGNDDLDSTYYANILVQLK